MPRPRKCRKIISTNFSDKQIKPVKEVYKEEDELGGFEK